MAGKSEPSDAQIRELTCPHKDEIAALNEVPKQLAAISKQQTDMYHRLFVQNGSNQGVDCLAVQIQKNTKARRQVESLATDERRSRWRRMSFYAAMIGIFLTSLFNILREFF